MKTCKRIILFALLCGLMLWTAAAFAASHQYGKVNANSVRFRKEAEKTDSWAMLDKGWPVEILDTKTVSGVKYYRVVCGTPNHPDREYWGYIQQKYVTKTSSRLRSSSRPPNRLQNSEMSRLARRGPAK